jgi:hypothetical protein
MEAAAWAAHAIAGGAFAGALHAVLAARHVMLCILIKWHYAPLNHTSTPHAKPSTLVAHMFEPEMLIVAHWILELPAAALTNTNSTAWWTELGLHVHMTLILIAWTAPASLAGDEPDDLLAALHQSSSGQVMATRAGALLQSQLLMRMQALLHTSAMWQWPCVYLMCAVHLVPAGNLVRV